VAKASVPSGNCRNPVENRQQIDVGECELVTCEIASLGDRLVKNPDLRARTAGVTASIALRSGLPSAVFGAA
jgi:hypothetical protein